MNSTWELLSEIFETTQQFEDGNAGTVGVCASINNVTFVIHNQGAMNFQRWSSFVLNGALQYEPLVIQLTSPENDCIIDMAAEFHT